MQYKWKIVWKKNTWRRIPFLIRKKGVDESLISFSMYVCIVPPWNIYTISTIERFSDCCAEFISLFFWSKQEIYSKTCRWSVRSNSSFLEISFSFKIKMPKKKAKSNKDVYEKAEDLPEGHKKRYDSILEDIDKQGM